MNVSKISFSGNETAFLVPFDDAAHENRVAALSGAWDGFSSDDDIYRLTDTHNNLTLQGNTTTPYVYATSNDYARLVFFNYSFGQDANRAYMQLEDGAFTTFDGIGCDNVTTSPHLADTYSPDTLPPFVETFNYNANTGVMTLVFSEPVHRHLEGNETTNVILMKGIVFQGASGIQSTLVTDSNYVQLVDYSDEDEIEVMYTSQYGREVAVYIGYNNMNLIKVGSYIARTASTTWFSLYNSAVANDTSGNRLALANMDQFSALEVTDFTPDTTSPTLLWWSYDVFLSKVTLRFSEVVDAMTFNYSAVYFTSNNTVDASSIKLRIDGDDDLKTTQTEDSNDIVITFSDSKYGELLDVQALLTNESNSYLVLQDGAPWDTSAAQNVYSDATTQADDARQVGYYIADLNQPSITSAVLDMTAKTLLLGFDKFVMGSSLNTSVLWMQSVAAAGTGTSVHYFDSASVGLADAAVDDTKSVNLQLSDSAYNYLKLFDAMSRRMDSTYIGFLTEFIHDKTPARNRIFAQPSSDAFGLTDFVTDTTSPTLSSWYADLDRGQIVLTFDEPLDLDSLDPTVLTLYSDVDYTASTTKAHQVANGTLYGSAPSSSTDASAVTVVTVQLDDAEQNILKDLTPLCQTYIRCFLSFPSSFGVDISTYNHTTGAYVNNSVNAVSVVQSSSTDHLADVTGPKVSSFTLDLGAGQIALSLNEPVYTGYFDASGLTIYNNSDNLNLAHTLTSSSFVEEYVDSQNLLVTLSRADYLAVKGLGIGENDTYSAFFTVAPKMLEDVSGNALNGTTDNDLGEPVMATTVVPDNTKPTLQAIYLAATRDLYLYFSDVIDLTTFDLTYMYLYSPAENEAQTLMQASLNDTGNTGNVIVHIPDVLDTELLSDGIAQTQAQTQFYTTSDEIFYDVPNANSGNKIGVGDAVGEGLQLLYWRMDLSNRVLRVACSHNCSYNGTVTAHDMTKFRIYSSISQTEVAFSAIDLLTTENDDTLVLQLDVATFADVTSVMALVDKSTLSLKVEQGGITDINGLYLGESSYSLTCRQIVIDTNAPNIEQYDLDLNTGMIDIYFDKPISIASVQLSTLTLYASQDSSSNNVNLGTATLVTTTDGVTGIEIDLSQGEFPTLRDQIHLSGDIGADVTSTYLQISKGFLTDTNEPQNYMPEVLLINATQPATLTIDDVLPFLEYWTFDMDAMVMNVTYSEAVDVSANIASYYLLLQDTSDTTSAQRYLTSSTTRAGSGRTVTIEIDNIDMNAIKLQYPNLCTSSADCLLSVRSGGITDISHNVNVYGGQLFAYATPPETYTPDTTPPTIQQFNFSAETGELYIEMSEIVSCATVDIGQLRLQYASFLGTSSEYLQTVYSSPDCLYATGALTKSLFVFLNVDDLTALRAKSALFKSIDSSFIGGGAGAFEDVFSNTFVSVTTGEAVQAVSYDADVSRPTLISYTVSAAKILFLYFSEPVDTGVFDVTQIQMSDQPYPNHDKAYNLSAASGDSYLYAASTNKMIIQVALDADFTRIYSESTIFEEQATTYLSVRPGLVSDTAGNTLISVAPEDAIGLGPNILAWQLDLNTGILVVEFSEEVFCNFTMEGLEFQRNVTRASEDPYVSLETWDIVTAMDSTNTIFRVLLFPEDLNALKYNNIGSTIKHSYLVSPFNLTFSTVASTLVPNLATSSVFDYRALQAEVVERDTTAPAIISFGLNLNEGAITVRFDEPVSLNSLDFTGFSLLSSTEGSTVAFTQAINATLVNLTNLVVGFSPTEFNNVKIADAEGDLDGLVVAAGAINDVFGNAYPGNDEADYIIEMNSTADSTPPVLKRADLNLKLGELLLTFNEVVDPDLFLPAYISILSAADPDDVGTTSIQLTNASLVTIDDQGLVTVDLTTYQTDKTRIDLETSLGTSTADTFILYDDIPDVYGNRVETPTVLQAASVTPDDAPIEVVAFDIADDYATNSKYHAAIYFNKVATVSSFVCSEYKVLLDNATDASSVTLADGDCSVSTTAQYYNTIEFEVTGTTATNINSLISGGGSGAEITLMEIQGNGGTGLSDSYGNYLEFSAYRLEIGPHVTRWFFDLNTGDFTLIFSAPVNTSDTFNSSSLGVYSPTTSEAYWLNSSSTQASQVVGGTPENSTNAIYTVDTADLNIIKALDVESGIYLMIREGMLMNSLGTVDVVNIQYTEAFEPYILTGDIARPVLVNTSFDIGNALLTLAFDEPIRLTSITQSNIKIASTLKVTTRVRVRGRRRKVTNSPLTIRLGAAGATPIRVDNSVTLTLNAEDQAELMLTAGIANNRTNTWVVYYSNTFYDFAGNAANSLNAKRAEQIGEYIFDNVSPQLQSFDANMENRQFTLYFSEPVVAASINTTAVIVSSRNGRTLGTYHRLTGGVILSDDSSSIIIRMTTSDLATIKGTHGLARDDSSLYLIVESTFCVDTSGNTFSPIVDGAGIVVSTFTADTGAPSVSSVDMDVENKRLSLSMSENVILSSVDLTALTVQDDVSSPANSHTLGDSSTIYNPTGLLYDDEVVIDFSAADMNQIKDLFPLVSTQATSCISITSSFITDVYDNAVTAIEATAAHQADTFTVDSSPPVVDHYSLDMNTLQITLTWDESIKFASVNTSEALLQQYDRAAHGESKRLSSTSASSSSGIYSVYVYIVIDSETASYLKYKRIADKQATSFFAFSASFASDNMDTYALAKWDGSIYLFEPLAPDTYTADTTAPTLTRWQIDRTNRALILHFNEPVLLNNATSIIISDSSDITSAGSVFSRLNVITNSTSDANYARAQYFHLYTDSCSGVNVTAGECLPVNLHSIFDSATFYLLMGASSFYDYAYAPNYNAALMTPQLAVLESTPDCSVCSNGNYISTVCTEVDDRVCSACSTCAAGYYQVEACSSYANTNCKECSSCAYGKYISTACGDGNDNSCSECTSCGLMEFESVKCLLGLNTECTTCENCVLDADEEAICMKKGKYQSWFDAHCCFDADGLQVSCNALDEANMKITARNGRHHWVFKDDSVDMDVYGMGNSF